MSGWKDIASAPRDGSKIDLWATKAGFQGGERVPERITDCWWGRDTDEWGREIDKETWVHYACGADGDYIGSVEPYEGIVTHWMSLPEPPCITST